jgi:tetratricopeptide (TPR) repeat protein
MRKYLILLFSILSFVAICQTYKQYIKFGDDNTKRNDHYGASLYYRKALEIDSIDVNLLWKYAESLRKYNNYVMAEYYYAKVFDREEGMVYPESIFYLASMKKYNGLYKEAKELFKKANKRYTRDRKGYLYLKTKKEIQSCSFALKESQKHDTSGYKFYNAGKKINSYDSEFGIALTDTALLFSSMRGIDERGDMEIYDPIYKVKVFSAKGTGKSFEDAKTIDNIINNNLFHNGNGAFSNDGKRFFFSRCDSLNHCKIYVSYFLNNRWQEPVALPSEINAKGNSTTHPAFAQVDGKEYLFFSSD